MACAWRVPLSRVAGTFRVIILPEAVHGPAFKAIGTGPFQLTEWGHRHGRQPAPPRPQAKISAVLSSTSGKACGDSVAWPVTRWTSLDSHAWPPRFRLTGPITQHIAPGEAR